MPVVQNTIKNDEGQEVTIYIEVDEKKASILSDSKGTTRSYDPYTDTRSLPKQVQTAFESATELIHTCAERIAHSIQTVPPQIRPKECEVQFAVKVDAELGAILAKSSMEAQLQVTLKWVDKE